MFCSIGIIVAVYISDVQHKFPLATPVTSLIIWGGEIKAIGTDQIIYQWAHLKYLIALFCTEKCAHCTEKCAFQYYQNFN